MLRAPALNLRRGRVVSGGSTITMQLVRLLRPAPRILLQQGSRRCVLALKLEQRLTKEQILWQYLNRAPYGNGTFGVEAAARRYLQQARRRSSAWPRPRCWRPCPAAPAATTPTATDAG